MEFPSDTNGGSYIRMSQSPNGAENTSANARQTVYLYGGQTYLMSFKYKNENAEKLELLLYSDTVSGNEVKIPSKGINWETYEIMFKIERTGSYVLWAGSRNAKGTYCFDDMVLTPMKMLESKEIEFYTKCDTKLSNGAVNRIERKINSVAEATESITVKGEFKDQGTLYLCVYTNESGKLKLESVDVSKSFGFDATIATVLLPSGIEKRSLIVRALLWDENMKPYQSIYLQN